MLSDQLQEPYLPAEALAKVGHHKVFVPLGWESGTGFLYISVWHIARDDKNPKYYKNMLRQQQTHQSNERCKR